MARVWPQRTKKGKAVPLQAWSVPEGSRKLRFPDLMTTAQDGGKVVSLTHRPPLLTYLLTYLLTPWSRVLLEKLIGSAASQEIPRIFGTRRFITALTIARHLSLS